MASNSIGKLFKFTTWGESHGEAIGCVIDGVPSMIPLNEKDQNLFGIKKLNVKRSLIPAVTHIDYSARIQTVHKDTNPKYYNLIKKFKEITNCPILVNTSFNVRGEPIVCTIEDAFRCFMGTNLDLLVCENFILYKERQDTNLLTDYKNKFNLD